MAKSKGSGDGKARRQGKKNRKFGRNAAKCAAYRARVGRPRGPGRPGNKKGKGRL